MGQIIHKSIYPYGPSMYTPLLFVDGTDDPQSNNPPLGTKLGQFQIQ